MEDYALSTQRVSVGRAVHYFSQSPGGSKLIGPFAATVVSCDSETGMCELRIFFPHEDPMQAPGIPYSTDPKAGCWSWPKRV